MSNIKTWRERAMEYGASEAYQFTSTFMEEEISDLRAALAKAEQEREELQAKLTEANLKYISDFGQLQAQEPVAIAGVHEKGCGPFDFEVTPYGIQSLDSGLTNLYAAAGAASVPVITKESIRAAGGIVHSDGNVFFTNIAQMQAMFSEPRSAS